MQDTAADGLEQMKTIVMECAVAKNEPSRHEGFSRSQRVLGKLPPSLQDQSLMMQVIWDPSNDALMERAPFMIGPKSLTPERPKPKAQKTQTPNPKP